MNNNQQEQLFTELTDEQSAVVEGGATFFVESIRAFNASKQDDLYMKVNGVKIISSKDINSNETRHVNKGQEFTSSARVQLWDDDRWPNGDDKLSTRYFSSTPRSGHYDVTGKGYHYRVNYRIFA